MSIGNANFTPKDGRPAPAVGDRVRVYRNLPLFKHRVFSILAMDGPYKGLVLGYSRSVGLERVKFIVSEATRQKVLKGNRTVHAYAEGFIVGMSSTLPFAASGEMARKVTYNPYLAGHFYDRDNPDTPMINCRQIWTWGSDLIILEQVGTETQEQEAA